MCTVTYVPKGNQSFVLTSSRDESVNRQRASAPEKFALNAVDAIFPKDASKGGTWIGASSNNRTLCLLNGAFEKHEPSELYIKSRGLVVLDFFNAETIHDFVNKYSFENVEPFTLVIIEYQSERTLYEFRWDGSQKHLNQLDATTHHIWSSRTLYTHEEAIKKEKIFSDFLKRGNSATDLFNIHERGISENPEIFKYHGIPHIITLSITQIQEHKEKVSLYYKTLENGQLHKAEMTTVNS